jgi:hypothetical protein
MTRQRDRPGADFFGVSLVESLPVEQQHTDMIPYDGLLSIATTNQKTSLLIIVIMQ